MRRYYDVCFDTSLFTPEVIRQAAGIVNAMSPLEFRGGLLSYADCVRYHCGRSSEKVRQAVYDGGFCLRRLSSNLISDFQVNVTADYVWSMFVEYWRPEAMGNDKNTVLMVDASPWIGALTKLVGDLEENTGIRIPEEFIISDAVDTIIGFQSRPLTLDSVDYFMMCLEERDSIRAPETPVSVSALMMEDRVVDAVREAVQTVAPYIENMVLMVRQQRNCQSDNWCVYRVADNRFVIEAGDGSQTIQNRNFIPASATRRQQPMEQYWFVPPE